MNTAYLTERLAYLQDAREDALRGLRAQRKTTLRANTLKTTAEAVEKALHEAGLSCERAEGIPDAFVLPGGSEKALRALPMYENGEIYLQSLAAMLPAFALGAKPGEDILDMAAAPGGKTSLICQLTEGKAFVTACEINHIRCERMKVNLQKLGCTKVNVMERDARKLDSFFRFDRVLLDAPCSGSGTLCLTDEKSCAAFSEKLVVNSARLQKELIRKAVQLLKPGGTLVYSTCSILEEENARAAEEIRRLGLEPDPVRLDEIPDIRLLPGSFPGTVTVCPDEKYEGFFIARFIRK